MSLTEFHGIRVKTSKSFAPPNKEQLNSASARNYILRGIPKRPPRGDDRTAFKTHADIDIVIAVELAPLTNDVYVYTQDKRLAERLMQPKPYVDKEKSLGCVRIIRFNTITFQIEDCIYKLDNDSNSKINNYLNSLNKNTIYLKIINLQAPRKNPGNWLWTAGKYAAAIIATVLFTSTGVKEWK